MSISTFPIFSTIFSRFFFMMQRYTKFRNMRV
jgi:hypothetical protein